MKVPSSYLFQSIFVGSRNSLPTGGAKFPATRANNSKTREELSTPDLQHLLSSFLWKLYGKEEVFRPRGLRQDDTLVLKKLEKVML